MNAAWLTAKTTIKKGYTSDYSCPSLTVKILQERLALSLLLKNHSYVTGEIRRFIVLPWEGTVIQQGEKKKRGKNSIYFMFSINNEPAMMQALECTCIHQRYEQALTEL